MNTKDILYHLRTERGLSQDELAAKIFVTRQAVSRWENGETIPNTETLKLLSKEFDVSINTLLGAPRQLICQCCGMPLEDDAIISRDSDGSLNEDYCKWCYADGNYTYSDMDDLIDICVKNMVNETKSVYGVFCCVSFCCIMQIGVLEFIFLRKDDRTWRLKVY